MNLRAINELFDSYGRTARLYPSLICFLPLLWHLPLVGGSLALSLPEGVLAVAVGGAVLYLVAAFARHKGKVAEQKLIVRWGTWPTTILLRHGDNRVDPITKARYHGELGRLANLVMPSAADEQRDPTRADAVYRSATKALIEARRDESHALLHKENAAYGFRRNLYGLRGVALGLAAVLLVGTVGMFLLQRGAPLSLQSILHGLAAEKMWAVAAILDLAYLACYPRVVTPDFVFESGVDYATALLRTLHRPEALTPAVAQR